MLHIPQPVKIIGWIHGTLFIRFVYFAFEIMGVLNKNFTWFFKAFAAAFVPLGTFIFDNELKKEADLLAKS